MDKPTQDPRENNQEVSGGLDEASAEIFTKILHWAQVRSMLAPFMFVATFAAIVSWKFQDKLAGPLSAMAIISTLVNWALVGYTTWLARKLR